jgi:hypothetical protein
MAEACPNAKELEPQVVSCGNNDIAATAARKCGEAVVLRWKAAVGTILPLLRQKDTSPRRERGLPGRGSADYQRAISTLKSEIRSLQKYASRVADYSEIMIDFPGAHDRASSAECFNRAFDQVEHVVSQLDDEIIRAKEMLAQLVTLAKREGPGSSMTMQELVLPVRPAP